MLIVKIWCLPKLDESKLHELHDKIVAAADQQFGVGSEKDMMNLFPVDAMSYGLGSEILVEVMEIPRMHRTGLACRELLKAFVRILVEMFPEANVHGIMPIGETQSFSSVRASHDGMPRTILMLDASGE